MVIENGRFIRASAEEHKKLCSVKSALRRR